MKKKANVKENDRFCGNCRYHNSYNYPDQIFCFVKFQKRENPISSALDCCSKWVIKPQECFCLDDALGKNEKKSQINSKTTS